MRAFAVFLAVCLMAGRASTPDHHISPAAVIIPNIATYWLDSVDVASSLKRSAGFRPAVVTPT